MSKRRGDVVFLDEFIDEVGVDFARWFLVDRGPRPDDRDRRRPRRREVAQEPRLLRPVRPRADQRHLPRGARAAPRSIRCRGCRSPPRSASSSSASPSSRESSREATERRGPHAIPVYAIRLADDFHRFYHEHVVLAAKGGDARVRSGSPWSAPRATWSPAASTSSASTRRSGCSARAARRTGGRRRPPARPRRRIEEYVGRASTGESAVSIARMRSPQGWAEPAQAPAFDEYTLVLAGLAGGRARGRPARDPRRRGSPHETGGARALQRRPSRAAPSTSRSACRRSRRRSPTENAERSPGRAVGGSKKRWKPGSTTGRTWRHPPRLCLTVRRSGT